MFTYDTLGLISQKAEAGDVRPAYFADVQKVLDPRRAGSSNGDFVGALGIGAASIVFTVPRDGLYWLEATLAAFSGAVAAYEFVGQQTLGGADLFRMIAIATSQGWRWGPWLILLQEGNTIRITNVTALGGGDRHFAAIQNFEIAMA